MPRPNIIIRDWLAAATPAEAREMAKHAKTSVPHLRHVAKGRRGMTAEFAQRLAHASLGMTNPALWLYQTELCTACAQCPLIKKKKTAKRS
jgi:plasmid maintenance system antidote protein VapI